MFDQLDRLEVTTTNTRPYKFDSIDLGGEGTPTIVVRCANESNASYYAAALKAQRERRGKDMTNAQIREVDAKLYARHCVVGWSNFVDKSTGKLAPVEFDTLACEQFLVKLAAKAPDLFTYFQMFIGDPANFRDTAPIDGAQLGKT